MHDARWGTVAVVVESKLLIAGGSNDDGDLASVEEYSPQTRSWARLADLPSSRRESCAALVPGQGWNVAGGMVDGLAQGGEQCGSLRLVDADVDGAAEHD